MKKGKFWCISTFISVGLIFIFYNEILAQTKLRDTPSKQKFKKVDIENIVKDKNFYDSRLNKKGDCTNDFVDNGDGTISDKATGLMWEQKGSKKVTSFYIATKHVKKLNKKKFAGYDDWRIPTIEELYSLLDPNTNKQPYINPVFETKAYHCWSADKSDLHTSFPTLAGMRGRYVTLDYKKGTVSDAFSGDQPGGASATNFRSFIRAVRSIK